MKKFGITAIAIFTLSFSAQAQEYCMDVIRYAAYNYSMTDIRNSIVKNLYDQSCSGSQSKENSTFSIGLEAVIDLIPFKGILGTGSSSEQQTNFCKIASSQFSQKSSDLNETKTVSPEAMQAYETCVRFASRGLIFKPQISTDSVSIGVIKRSADPEYVKGIIYDGAKRCITPDDDRSNNSKIADKNTRKTLLNGQAWNIMCKRLYSTSEGKKNYHKATINIGTSSEVFNLIVPPDAELPLTSAAEIDASIKKMGDELKLECKVRTATSSRGRYPGVSASMTDEEKKAGFQVTGGGCRQIKPDENFALIHTHPEGDASWFCQSGDLPGIPGVVQIEAHVVFCRLSKP